MWIKEVLSLLSTILISREWSVFTPYGPMGSEK
jgi:hypothetical protein